MLSEGVSLVKVGLHAIKIKILLMFVIAAVLIASIASFGQSVKANEASEDSTVGMITSNDLEDGSYYIDFTVLYANENKPSMSAQYMVSPALLKVEDNKKTISFTVLQSKEIVGLKINNKEGVMATEDANNNSRIVTFEIEDLTAIQPAWISINWVIDTIKFEYIHEYDIRFKLLPDTLTAVAGDASVPTKEGNVGFPSGYGDGDESDDVDNNQNDAVDDGSNKESDNIQPADDKSFNDIEGHWAQAAIEHALQLGIADGYGDGIFKPNAVISRSEFAVMISRALKLSAQSSTSSFADQKTIPAWAEEHVNRVVTAGLIGGYSDLTFRGSNNITRAELAVIVTRAAQLDVIGVATLGFEDASHIPDWAKNEIAAAVNAGLVSGKGGNRFEPNASATRAEALTLIMRVLDVTK